MRAKTMEPVHPGEILVEEFLTPLSVSQSGSPKISACRPGV